MADTDPCEPKLTAIENWINQELDPAITGMSQLTYEYQQCIMSGMILPGALISDGLQAAAAVVSAGLNDNNIETIRALAVAEDCGLELQRISHKLRECIKTAAKKSKKG